MLRGVREGIGAGRRRHREVMVMRSWTSGWARCYYSWFMDFVHYRWRHISKALMLKQINLLNLKFIITVTVRADESSLLVVTTTVKDNRNLKVIRASKPESGRWVPAHRARRDPVPIHLIEKKKEYLDIVYQSGWAGLSVPTHSSHIVTQCLPKYTLFLIVNNFI